MHDSPDADDLLAAARTSVLHELLAALPETQHYEALMVANALAIARRMWIDEAHATEFEVNAIQFLYGEAPMSAADAQNAGRELRRRLAADIRLGAFDLPTAQGRSAQRLLFEQALRRVRVTSPKLAAQAGNVLPIQGGARG